MSTIAVIAKAPVAGRVKTRLCPPCTANEAAALAEAALRDTLAAVAATRVDRRVLALESDGLGFDAPGFEVLPQRGEALGDRLAALFEDVGGPAFVVGMDTPQVTPELLAAGVAALTSHDAVLGPAEDGGYWGVGLRAPDRRVFAGVPMSAGHTGRAQRRRLAVLGLRTAELPWLRDVDTFADVAPVAALAPRSRFAGAAAPLMGRESAARDRPGR